MFANARDEFALILFGTDGMFLKLSEFIHIQLIQYDIFF